LLRCAVLCCAVLCCGRYTEQAQAEEQKLAKKNKARLDDEVGTRLHHILPCTYHAPLPVTWPHEPDATQRQPLWTPAPSIR
jgi:hypothetical protein